MRAQSLYRTIDHSTSIDAARSVLPKLSKLQQAVLGVLRRHHAETHDGMTDLQLEQHELFSSRRPSTIRKRRLELQRMGYVADSGRTRGKLTVWIPVAAESRGGIPTVTPAKEPTRPKFTPRQLTRPARRDWTDEECELLAWFQQNRTGLPAASFHLAPGVRVIEPAKFLDSIIRDIEAGPSGCRSRSGALQADLKRLRELFGQPQQHGCTTPNLERKPDRCLF